MRDCELFDIIRCQLVDAANVDFFVLGLCCLWIDDRAICCGCESVEGLFLRAQLDCVIVGTEEEPSLPFQ
jgi:hypothetical protein